MVMCDVCDEIEKAQTGKTPKGKTSKGTPNLFVREYERDFRAAFATSLGKMASDIVKQAEAMTK